eukprot:8075885-Alexandrium_andersonii.AAC.1
MVATSPRTPRSAPQACAGGTDGVARVGLMAGGSRRYCRPVSKVQQQVELHRKMQEADSCSFNH